jgi:hypothetical protein
MTIGDAQRSEEKESKSEVGGERRKGGGFRRSGGAWPSFEDT